jgi:hypothetical protein
MANRGKNIILSEEDIEAINSKASRGAHRLMMDMSSVRSAAHKNKKAYNRKKKHKGNNWD